MYAQEGAGQTGPLGGKTKPSKAKDVVVQDMIAQLADNILAGDRRALARAITLIESSRDDHRADATRLLEILAKQNREAVRIGLSGTPGVGKSTFVESFGMMLIERGLRVAVLAVDPSSARSGGSILGDKTRMERLSRAPGAFIRPSPSQLELGGVARRTRDASALCEAAGYDVVIIETVGVGQSETIVAQMSDLFLLLLAPAGGDELQGVKRGIMEMADLIVVNKADGDLAATARRTMADYSGALGLMRKRDNDPEGFPKCMAISALHENGLTEVWDEMTTLLDWRREHGHWAKHRAEQRSHWFTQEVRLGLLAALTENQQIRDKMQKFSAETAKGDISPTKAAQEMLKLLS